MWHAAGLAILLSLGLSAGCRDKRRPLARGDAGPAVVLVDRRAPDLALAEAAPELEPNDSVTQAQALEPDARVGGVIALTPPAGKPDLDWFVLRASQPKREASPTPDLGSLSDAGLAQPSLAFVTLSAGNEPLSLELVDLRGRGLLVRTAPAHGRAQLSYLRLDPSTPTFVRVRGSASRKAPPVAPAAYTLEQTTRIAMLDEELEPNDDAAHATVLPASGSLSGRLDGASDRDLIVLPALPEGATYRVELAGLPELAPELRLRDGETVLATARAARGGELRLRNLPGHGQGPLYLVLRSFEGESELPYSLRVSSEPALDAAVEHEPNDERARATLVHAGDVVAGYLWAGDVDWFCLADGLGFGARIEGLAEVDWKLETTDATGASRKKVDEGRRGAGEQVELDALARCLRVSARPRDLAFEAPYRLSFTASP